jgi:aminopeptidase-like protein
VKRTDGEGQANSPEIGHEIHRLIADLYPICRSITGDGVRETLARLKAIIPLETNEVSSGTPVFDWTVPKEWNIRDAYIKNHRGERTVDFRKSNLHVVSYSVPLKARLSRSQLEEHVFTLPDHPDWIPYRTSYYKENWGFCLSHNQWLGLPDGEYDVCIDSSLQDGHLTYGEYYLRGERADEVLISCHVCHPSLCNDNLSGVALVAFVAKHLSQLSLRYSYRFLFIPGTIGSITWLSLNEAHVSRIKHGLVVAGVGDPGKTTYKKSRRGDAEIDRAVTHVLKHSGSEYEIQDFVPYGYDERQFGSPGFNLPMGCFMRTPHGQYAEYHTSADDLSFVQPQFLADSYAKCLSVLAILEKNGTYVNQNPKGEPQLGKRGLYRPIGGSKDVKQSELAMLWVLNFSDGNHSLLDIADKSGLDFTLISAAAEMLLEHGLLKGRPD